MRLKSAISCSLVQIIRLVRLLKNGGRLTVAVKITAKFRMKREPREATRKVWGCELSPTTQGTKGRGVHFSWIKIYLHAKKTRLQYQSAKLRWSDDQVIISKILIKTTWSEREDYI